MAYNIVGLDIGSRTVRAVLMERSFRGYEISEARQALITQGADGSPPTADAVAAAVAEVIGDLAPGQTTTVCAYPLERASVWYFNLPFNDPRRIAQTVSFEVEDMVPFDLEDMIFTYRMNRADGNTSQIMATLAPRKDVSGQLATLQRLGVNPIALLLDAHVVANALPDKRPQARAVLDIGHRRTVLSVVRDGAVEHMVALPVGGWTLTRALMERWDLPFEVAEHLKLHRRLPDGYQLRASIPQVVDESSGRDAPAAAADGDLIEADEADDEGDIPTLSWRALDDTLEAEVLTDLADLDVAAAAFGEETTSSGATMAAVARLVEELPEEAEGLPGASLPFEQTDGLDHDAALDAALAEAGFAGPAPQAREPVTPELVEQTLLAALQQMIGPIRAGLVAYEANHRREVEAVLLVGGGAQLPELGPALEADLGVNARRIERLGENKVTIPGATSPSSHALAFALGLRGVTDGKLKEVDFRREEFASRGDIQRQRVAMVAALAAVLMLAVVGLAWSALTWRGLRQDVKHLDEQITQLVKDNLPPEVAATARTPEQALVLLTDEQMVFSERARILGVGDNAPPSALRVLKEVSENLSPGEPGDSDFQKVDVDDYQATEQIVKLKGYTDSFDATGKIEASLKKSQLFTDVTMSDVTSDRRRDDRKNFTITMSVTTEGSDLEVEDPS